MPAFLSSRLAHGRAGPVRRQRARLRARQRHRRSRWRASSGSTRRRGRQAALRERLHLDQPLVLRYLYYLGATCSGGLGNSYGAQRPMADLLAERMPANVELAVAALVLSLALGVPLGVYAAAHPRASRLVRVADDARRCSASRCRPSWSGILLIAFFSLMLGWLPSFGRGEVVQDRVLDDRPADRLGPEIAGHARGEPGDRADRARRPLDPRRDAGRASSTRLHPLRPCARTARAEPCISPTPCATR